MPTHKVIARVALMPADRKCAELEGYNMLLCLDKGLYFFFFFLSQWRFRQSRRNCHIND